MAHLLAILTLAAAILPVSAFAQAGAGSSDPSAEEDKGRKGVEIVGHVLKPIPLEWSEERMERLALPQGFDINVYARNLKNARMMPGLAVMSLGSPTPLKST